MLRQRASATDTRRVDERVRQRAVTTLRFATGVTMPLPCVRKGTSPRYSGMGNGRSPGSEAAVGRGIDAHIRSRTCVRPLAGDVQRSRPSRYYLVGSEGKCRSLQVDQMARGRSGNAYDPQSIWRLKFARVPSESTSHGTPALWKPKRNQASGFGPTKIDHAMG
jgi:hypothetical protein